MCEDVSSDLCPKVENPLLSKCYFSLAAAWSSVVVFVKGVMCYFMCSRFNSPKFSEDIMVIDIVV